MNNKLVKTRMAPSPTGVLHIGSARTTLFDYLYAKKMGGIFILRIDDTDKERSKKEFEDNIIDSIAWLGITYDEFYRQSERTEIYKAHIQKLIDEDKAYISQEVVEKEGDRSEVIRFRNPGKTVTFQDEIRGDISFDTTELGDFVIAKDLETPLYHLTSVVDDVVMGITHIIRVEDHISNTPRQILLFEAFGAQLPVFAHIPLILAPDRSKLSKRHGAVSLTEYQEEGYLPETIINFLALLGWSPQAKTSENEGTDREIFSLDELIPIFSLAGVQKSGAIFNVEKLKWLNKEYIKKLTPEAQLEALSRYIPENEALLARALSVIIDRISTFKEARNLYEDGEFDYFFKTPEYTKETLKNQDHFDKLITLLEAVPENSWNAERVKAAVWEYATEQGRGNVLWPMRVALSGKERSADPFTIASVVGKTETLKRLANAKTL